MDQEDLEIEIFRQKKLLKYLRDAKGNGTSMISLIIPPGEQLSKTSRLLTDEYGTATNIKSRVNRLSVLGGITSAQTKLKTYNKNPPNGLAIYAGTVLLDGNKEKRISVGIEPVKPINTSLYMCDSRFHVEELMALFEDNQRYGFIIIDGHGALLAMLQGSVQTILQNIYVDLPKKHGRGGQSSVRFARLRVEKRLAYLKKVAELITNTFITNSMANVEGIILAGCADLKVELEPMVDKRISVLGSVNTIYGGKSGLNEAIDKSEGILKDMKYAREKRALQKFLCEINMDTGKYCYGFDATMNCLESGMIETLIIWEGIEKEYQEQPLIDWISENYKDYGCKLVVVTNSTPEGTQFVEGFGGFGGLLRYKINIEDYDVEDLGYCSMDEDIF